MVKVTYSLAKFFELKGKTSDLALLMFGHTEIFTPEMQEEYFKWVQTPEGLSYLKGGANYKEDWLTKRDGSNG